MEEKKPASVKTANNHKMALLRIMEYLMIYTDEEHPANSKDLKTYLEKWNISEERRTIYSDVAVLADFGIDIEKAQGGWYIASRTFELPELKLLVDAVQASNFITEKKSGELIRKLERETSCSQAELLNRELWIRSGHKTDNETVFYTIDAIHEAIHRNCQIQFQYGEINLKKQLVMKRGGARYQLSPWALVWQDENYYMIAYDAEEEIIKHFRVDKMMKAKVVADEERLGSMHFRDFDLDSYLGKTFSMFSGPDAEVKLRCAPYLAGVMTERFGQDVLFVPEEDGSGYFHVTVTVAVSVQFYGWLAGLGGGVEILSPLQVRFAYRDYLKKLVNMYES